MAAITLVMDNDDVAKNYFLYCDTNDGANSVYDDANPKGTNEWGMIPWDKDLTFGKDYGFADYQIYDPYAHPFFGDSDHPKVDGPYNWLIDALLDIPEIKQMYLRRLRTVMDELLQPPGTPYADRNFESQLDEIYAELTGDPVVVSHTGNLSSYYNDIKTSISTRAARTSISITARTRVTPIMPAFPPHRPMVWSSTLGRTKSLRRREIKTRNISRWSIPRAPPSIFPAGSCKAASN